MRILIIDGQGGGLGKNIIEQLKRLMPECHITAVGTNAVATASMLKGGADVGATGENAVVYNAKNADFIAGAMGICFANAMHGEISPTMALAVCESPAKKLLIPIAKCNIEIIGTSERSMSVYINELAEKIFSIYKGSKVTFL